MGIKKKTMKRNVSRNSESFDKTALLDNHNMELLLLLQILVNMIVLFKMNNIDVVIQKNKIKQLLDNLKNNNKLISSKTTSHQIQQFINSLLEYVNTLLESYISSKYKNTKRSVKTSNSNNKTFKKIKESSG